jgi:stearoyl-CoA desaturase (delta-9 desaturase)
MYLLTAIGITVGFHRLLTHRSFQTSKPLEHAFAVLGSMAVQGPVISWVADHRKHHAHTDSEGAPHSPHVGHEGGLRGVAAGLWHAHTGWLMSTQGRADWRRYAADLNEDRGMRLIARQFVPLVGLTLLLPALTGYLVSGSLAGAATGLLGRAGADLLRPPRDLERKFRLPLFWYASVCDGRPLDKRLLARPAFAG